MRGAVTLPGRILRAILARRGATIVHFVDPSARRDLSLIRDSSARALFLVQDGAALQILAYVRAARRLGGAMAELGVFAGGTARLICEAKGDAPLHLFDVFETLQGAPATAHDSSQGAKVRARFGSWHTPVARVQSLLASYSNVFIHQGVFPSTATEVQDETFSFVHLDADLNSSTRDGLEFFYPRLRRGGVIIVDDYNLAEVRSAFDDFFAKRDDTVVVSPWSQVIAIKTASV
jgi:hypothetical protein